jgi:hypothetical protein
MPDQKGSLKRTGAAHLQSEGQDPQEQQGRNMMQPTTDPGSSARPRRSIGQIFGLRQAPGGPSRAQAAMLARQSRAAQNPTDESAKLYKIAFDESVRTLKQQNEELSAIRQRLVQFLAFVGTATAFLIGTSLRPEEGSTAVTRGPEFLPLCSAGTVAMVVTLGLTLVLLYPRTTPLTVVSSAREILDGIHRDVSPTDTEAHLLHDLAWYYDGYVKENAAILAKARWYYFSAIGAGVLQLSIWTALIWTQVNPSQ